MKPDYQQEITESEEELRNLERDLRGRASEPRVRMLRLLKSGCVSKMNAAAPLIGYSLRQLQRWWKKYKLSGIEQLTKEASHPGKVSRLTEEAYQGLEASMKAGDVSTLTDARAYLKEEWHIEYNSLNGVWRQLHKRKAKPKTGRRVHKKTNPKAQQEFKSGFRTEGRGI